MSKIENLVRPNILKLEPYSSARDEFSGKDAIFLDANENPFGSLNRYPDPYQKELKAILSDLKNVEPKNIFVGNGSDEVIDLAFRIFCNPGVDKAITFSPTYGMYDVSAAINNVELVKLPLKDEFQIDLDILTPYFNMSNIKLLLICSPNNPIANLMDKRDVEFILQNFKGIVLLDEAYIDFAPDESFIGLLGEYQNLIISQTFSKAWGLAAARVGLAYSSEEIISLYNKVKPPYNVSELNQKAAIAALENSQVYRENLKTILAEKERLKAALLQINLVKKVFPSDTNFLLLEVSNANELYTELVAKQIITRNRNKQISNCIRITVGTQEENNKLINALKNRP